MNNDELQKAIDDITKNDVGGGTEGTSENEALVDEMVKGMPTTGEAPALTPVGEQAEVVEPQPEAPELKIPEVGAMPPTSGEETAAVEAAPVAPEVSTTVPEAPITNPAAAEVNMPETFSAPEAADLEKVEKEALKELYPLLSVVSLPADEKFEICMRVFETDKTAISGALDAAKQISDEKKKAEALLKIIDAVK